MNFFEWLLTQQKRDDPIGDLAQDVKTDKCFPKDAQTLKDVENHLKFRHRADRDALQALRGAWKEYKNTGP